MFVNKIFLYSATAILQLHCHMSLEGSDTQTAGTKDKGLLLSSLKPETHFYLLNSYMVRFFFVSPASFLKGISQSNLSSGNDSQESESLPYV